MVGQYLADSDRPEVDRAIAEAIASGVPMEALARRIDVPARTLRYRQDLLLRHCRRRLGLDG